MFVSMALCGMLRRRRKLVWHVWNLDEPPNMVQDTDGQFESLEMYVKLRDKFRDLGAIYSLTLEFENEPLRKLVKHENVSVYCDILYLP